jgi:hypothetical protein
MGHPAQDRLFDSTFHVSLRMTTKRRNPTHRDKAAMDGAPGIE